MQANSDKIPGAHEWFKKRFIISIFAIWKFFFTETSEDISPYATFQLSEAGAPTNALLHSFMYHEQALTEGCASPPPVVSFFRFEIDFRAMAIIFLIFLGNENKSRKEKK